MKTNLDQLYSLRKNFSVIGLTGRTGSGSSELANMLSKEFQQLENIRNPEIIDDLVFQKKFKIVSNFTKQNWKTYRVIEYRKVLLLILLPELHKNPDNTQLFDYYRDKLRYESDEALIKSLKVKIQELIKSKVDFFKKIIKLGEISDIKTTEKLKELNDVFWGHEFASLSDNIDTELKANGITERVMLLHHTASNFRRSGQPFKTSETDTKYIYKIAKVINRVIKATKQESENGECHIVIDSLRNSLEINFFKERYSAFYLVAVKSDRRKTKITAKYHKASSTKIDRMLEMDEIEYQSSDFQKGIFYVPDVQNCIQMADYHVNNHQLDETFKSSSEINSFYSIDEQLIKLQGLIQQPGLITPDPTERAMQIAFTAKLNSGCISRQVGAVVTDNEFSTKAIGWNDVPKGALPCSLRNIKEIGPSDPNNGFTQFELGKGLKETERLTGSGKELAPQSILELEIDKESKDFHRYILGYCTFNLCSSSMVSSTAVLARDKSC